MDHRNQSLDQIARILRDQHVRKVDITAPYDHISAHHGQIVVQDTGEPVITMDGVTPSFGTYDVTPVADEGLSTRLGIPVAYLRSLRGRGLPLLVDQNINGLLWAERERAKRDGQREPRAFLRTLKPVDGAPGVLRAVLSDRYRTIDNLDVLVAALDGVRSADVSAQVEACDLSDRRMYIRVVSEGIRAMAPDLLRGYRSPFEADPNIRRAGGGWTVESGREAARREGSAYTEGSEPVVFAGFEIRNSEVGQGGFKIVPRLVVKICRNGLTIPVDALSERHIGGRLDDGVVELSQRTVNAALELVTARTADAVRQYLTPAYVQSKVDDLSEAAGTPVERPEKVVTEVARTLRFTDGERDGILRHFLTGGQATAGGVMQAVTSYAQCVSSADSAAALEDSALRVLSIAAASAR